MTAKELKRRAIAAGWIKDLITRGLTVTAISERAEVHYNTVRTIRDSPDGNIDENVYRKLRLLAEKENLIVSEPSAEYSSRKEKSNPALSDVPVGFKVRGDENGDKHVEVAIPKSAREFYEGFEFHGGKVDWLELDEESRSFYENIHSLLLHSIDSLNERFAAGLRELRAARERELRAALEEFEKTFRKRMIGLLGN